MEVTIRMSKKLSNREVAEKDSSKKIKEHTYKLWRDTFGCSEKDARRMAKISERAWRPAL